MITILENEGFIPVISPIGVDELGNSYNINADYVAGEIAGALGASKFFLMTDVAGILKDVKDATSLITEISYEEVQGLIDDGTVSGGMLPKVDACMTAIKAGQDKSAHNRRKSKTRYTSWAFHRQRNRNNDKKIELNIDEYSWNNRKK